MELDRTDFEQVTLSPVNAAGAQEAWGRVEIHLFPDYHDDYHGGDVSATYF